MKVSLFDYHLPEELIAQYPLPERDESRLMVLNRSKKDIQHSQLNSRLNKDFSLPKVLGKVRCHGARQKKIYKHFVSVLEH